LRNSHIRTTMLVIGKRRTTMFDHVLYPNDAAPTRRFDSGASSTMLTSSCPADSEYSFGEVDCSSKPNLMPACRCSRRAHLQSANVTGKPGRGLQTLKLVQRPFTQSGTSNTTHHFSSTLKCSHRDLETTQGPKSMYCGLSG
jgi:hypothetical protein